MKKKFALIVMMMLFVPVVAQADDYYVKHKGDKRAADGVEGMATI